MSRETLHRSKPSVWSAHIPKCGAPATPERFSTRYDRATAIMVAKRLDLAVCRRCYPDPKPVPS